jgi:hypothetical protein
MIAADRGKLRTPPAPSRGNPPMLRISLPFIYNLAEQLEPITNIATGTQYNDIFIRLYVAESTINTFLNGSVFAPYIKSCRVTGNAIIQAIQNINANGTNRALNFAEIYPITNGVAQFKTAMLAEIGVFPSYFVTQKGGFETDTLLEGGERLFPDDLRLKVAEAVFDVKEAAKALAYEIPTAAGFHIFRATESVLRRYYGQVTGGQPAPKMRTIKVYVRQMRISNCGDSVVLTTLDQMADLHRNPLIHPEAVLTMDEAISTLGIARSAATAMLKVLPVIPPTTTTVP